MKEMFGSDAVARMRCSKNTMPCKRCGAIMTQGSGHFPTDYNCKSCNADFNGAGQEMRQEPRNYRQFDDDYDYCGNDD